jgi:predicted  nucleic acid-binding Zn-ribbon protein
MLYAYFEDILAKLESLKSFIEASRNDNIQTLTPESINILTQMLEILENGLSSPIQETLVYNLYCGVTSQGEAYFQSSYWSQDDIVRGVGFKILAYWKTLPELYKRKSSILDLNKRHEELNRLTIEATTALDEVQRVEKQIADIYASTNGMLQIISGYEEKVVAQQNNQLLDTIQTIHKKVMTLDNEIEATCGDLKEYEIAYQEQLEEISKKLDSLGKAEISYENLTKKILTQQTEINTLQQRSSKLLTQISSAAQAEEFGNIKHQKDINARWWLVAGCFLVFLIMYGAYYIASSQGLLDVNPKFMNKNSTVIDILYIVVSKFSILFPLVGLNVFVFHRYLKEKRLAEEYRFKHTFAMYMSAYKDLVKEACSTSTTHETDHPADKEYREFLISQIKELFTSPTERMYKDSNPDNFKAVQDTLELIFPQLEKLKNLMNLGTKTTE